MTFYDKSGAILIALSNFFTPIDNISPLGYSGEKHFGFDKKKEELKKSYNLVSLHNHSTFSDGELDLENYITRAIKNGYDIVSITDHNTTDAFKSLYDNKEIGRFKREIVNAYTIKILGDDEKEVLYFLKGEEITTKDGHINVIGEKMPKSGQSLEDTLLSITEDDFVIANHPMLKIARGIGEENLRRYKDFFDAVEANGSIAFPFGFYYNTKAKAIAEDLKIPVVAAPDAHIKGVYFNSFLTLVKKDISFDEDMIIRYLKNMLNEGKYQTVEQSPDNINIIKWTLRNLFNRKSPKMQINLKDQALESEKINLKPNAHI